MTIELVFLARLRERFGVSRERINLLVSPATVSTVLTQLRERGGAFAEELAPNRAFRVAVNQEVVAINHSVSAGDEVAIFPPVTGG
jgi:sulfur-carrier protein